MKKSNTDLKKPDVGVKAEWHKPKIILMHRPGIEALIFAAHYPSGLYERPIDLAKAQEQHDYFRRILTDKGAEVHLVEDLLKKASSDRIEELAERYLRYKGKGMLSKDKYDLLRKKDKGLSPIYNGDLVKKETLKHFSNEDLIKLIFLNLTVEWDGFSDRGMCGPSTKTIEPLGSLMFTRDQMITTDRGVVLGRMKGAQRDLEIGVIRAALETLGIKPIYEIKPAESKEDGGYLEGGDFFPMNDFCLLGIGLRTDTAAAYQLLRNGVFGYERVVLVHNRKSTQDEMHLDTYLNIISSDAVAMLGDRVVKEDAPSVEVWYQQGKGYKKDKSESGMLLSAFLKDNGFKILGVPRNQQIRYGLNFLNIGEDEMIGRLKDAIDIRKNRTHKKVKKKIGFIIAYPYFV